jgi:hypothetical protein
VRLVAGASNTWLGPDYTALANGRWSASAGVVLVD